LAHAPRSRSRVSPQWSDVEEADDVAGAAAYLLSGDAAGVTATTLYVDSGYHAMGMKGRGRSAREVSDALRDERVDADGVHIDRLGLSLQQQLSLRFDGDRIVEATPRVVVDQDGPVHDLRM
jgi:Enoyl-(Acyl carrier protein) reductase